MIFTISFNNKKIEEAASLANTFLMTVKLVDLQKITPFTYLPEVPEEDHTSAVFSTIKSLQYFKREIEIAPWSPWNRWTRAIATTFGDGVVHINIRKIDQFEAHDYVNTLVHETCHNLGFSHGAGPTANFVTKEKLKSVPFALGSLAEAWSRSNL